MQLKTSEEKRTDTRRNSTDPCGSVALVSGYWKFFFKLTIYLRHTPSMGGTSFVSRVHQTQICTVAWVLWSLHRPFNSSFYIPSQILFCINPNTDVIHFDHYCVQFKITIPASNAKGEAGVIKKWSINNNTCTLFTQLLHHQQLCPQPLSLTLATGFSSNVVNVMDTSCSN